MGHFPIWKQAEFGIFGFEGFFVFVFVFFMQVGELNEKVS